MADIYKIAMFGEAERGRFHCAYFLDNLPQLVDNLGNPPPDSQGLHFAVQTLMYNRPLIFFRVEEEGYSRKDYLKGLQLLKSEKLMPHIAALCLPGVGDRQLIDRVLDLCKTNSSILILSEPDLYDYLTSTSTTK